MDEIIPQQILDKIYALGRHTGSDNFKMKDVSKEPYCSLMKIDSRNRELVECPETVERERRGFCYDQTFLVRKWLDEIGIKSRMFYSVSKTIKRTDNGIYYYDSPIKSHMFIIVCINGEYDWIEFSWYNNRV